MKTVTQKQAYEDLANAIITRACDDYTRALSRKDAGKIHSLERFFNSTYFCMLTKIEGKYLIERLRKEFYGRKRKSVER